ncbi:hypothetical protein BDF14DRAFT_560670 [Spinellus fusiger]|nr:hypothetical protein BDF14DRAFT_560670 [Spinellus fusiger]
MALLLLSPSIYVKRIALVLWLHSDLQVRQDLFLALHHTSRKQLNSSTHSVLQPVILCLRHFIFQSHTTCYQPLNNHEVMGLLIASLCSLGHLLGYTWKDLPNILSKPKLVKHSLHLAAQWQGVIYASHLLSQLLCHRNEHLETPHILASFFNGVYVHAALQASRSGDSLAILLANASPHFRDMVCHTWALVTDGLENAILPVFDYKLPRLGQGSVPESYWIESGNLKKKAKSLEDPKRQKVMKKVAKKSVSPHKNSKNAFDVLSFGCSFDD